MRSPALGGSQADGPPEIFSSRKVGTLSLIVPGLWAAERGAAAGMRVLTSGAAFLARRVAVVTLTSAAMGPQRLQEMFLAREILKRPRALGADYC